MSSKKKMAAVLITIAALTTGSVATASADKGPGNGDVRATVLSALVTAGTITQAQADAITKKFEEVMAGKHTDREANKAVREAHRAALETLVASTIGIDAATIKARLVAGESLATIAGAKKDALIAALVAFETKEIDARVAAGKLTAEEGTARKATLVAQVTAAVNAIGPRSMGPKGMGNNGVGHEGKGPKAGKGAKEGKGKRN